MGTGYPLLVFEASVHTQAQPVPLLQNGFLLSLLTCTQPSDLNHFSFTHLPTYPLTMPGRSPFPCGPSLSFYGGFLGEYVVGEEGEMQEEVYMEET